MFGARQREEEDDDEKQRRRRRTKKRESFATKRRFISNIIYRGESKIGTPPPLFRESSLVPSFDLRDEDYSVVDVNDDTQTTTT